MRRRDTTLAHHMAALATVFDAVRIAIAIVILPARYRRVIDDTLRLELASLRRDVMRAENTGANSAPPRAWHDGPPW